MKDTKKLDKRDVGLAVDLSFALKNLVGAEDHLYKSWIETKNPMFKELLNKIRGIRSDWLKALVNDDGSESWCISKHLLGASMGLVEVGVRFNQTGQEAECNKAFQDSVIVLEEFFKLNGFTEEGEVISSA